MKSSLLKSFLLTILILFFGCSLLAQQYSSYIDPFIGSVGDGNIFIGPSCPFGMVKPGPDCSKTSNSGYSSDTTQTIYGFSQVHVSGTGGGPKYGNIAIMPYSGDFESTKHESLRAGETTKVGYYSVLLKKWNISTESRVLPFCVQQKAKRYKNRFG